MNFLKENCGASAVEFGIVLPFLFLLIFGIIEFSLALYDKAMITNASREGARAGIVYRLPAVTDAEIMNVVSGYLNYRLVSLGSGRSGRSGPTVIVARNGFSPGSELRVKVLYTYNFLVFPRFASIRTGGISMTAETVMRME